MNRRKAIVGGVAGVTLIAFGLPVALLVAITGLTPTDTSTANTCQPASPVAVTADNAGFDAEQMANAAIIISVGQAMVGPQGEVIAVTAAIVESQLENLPGGDRDSVGLFQERPSQGWGTAAQISDPVYASTVFYEHLIAVPGWQTMAPGDAAQAVERSAFPDRYAVEVDVAQAIIAGVVPDTSADTVTCPVVTLPANLPPAAVAEIAAAPSEVHSAISFAVGQLGKPYEWGATGPNSWDCSGLTQASWAAAGMPIPRTTYGQVTIGTDVTGGPYVPGDLLFPEIGHVELYIGAGLVIEAPHTGTDVQIAPMPTVWMARRVVT